MRTVYILLYLSILFVQLNAQQLPIQDYKRDHKWPMGYRSLRPLLNTRFPSYEFNFNALPFRFDTFNYRQVGLFSTNLSMCDPNGELLFFCNGAWVSNRQFDSLNRYDQMLNPGFFTLDQEGSGCGVPQGGVMLPRPNDTNLVDILHIRVDYVRYDTFGTVSGTDVLHTLLDKRLNNGRGGIVFANRPFMQDTFSNKMTACRHGNGRDWWVVHNNAFGNRYYLSFLGPNGPEIMDTIVMGSQTSGAVGPAEFSRDGKHYVHYEFDKLRIFDFDRCDGTFSNYRELSSNYNQTCAALWGRYGGGALGGAFSSDSKYFYFGGCAKFYRLELATLAIDSLDIWDGYRDTTGVPPGGFSFPTNPSEYRIGPDGRIYVVTQSSTTYMHIIEQPNLSSPRVRQRGIRLPTYSYSAPPNIPNFRLGAEDGTSCDTLGIDNVPWLWWGQEATRVREDAGTVTLPFSIQHPPQAGQTVQARLRFIRPYSSCDQDQEAVLLDTLLTFAQGVTSTSARLQIINDLDIEPTDTICYALTEITGGAVAPTWYGYIFIQDDESSGLTTNFGESGILVYPNPAGDYLTIDARDTQLENANYSLIDALGRSVLTGNLLSQKQWLDLTGIQSGMYFLELREEGRLLEVRKVLKQ